MSNLITASLAFQGLRTYNNSPFPQYYQVLLFLSWITTPSIQTCLGWQAFKKVLPLTSCFATITPPFTAKIFWEVVYIARPQFPHPPFALNPLHLEVHPKHPTETTPSKVIKDFLTVRSNCLLPVRILFYYYYQWHSKESVISFFLKTFPFLDFSIGFLGLL